MKLPVHVSAVEAQTWYEGTDRAIAGKPLCDVSGIARVGVGYLELPSGSNTRPAQMKRPAREQQSEHIIHFQEITHAATAAA